MRYFLLVFLLPLLAGCTSMELAQWTSAMDTTAGGGNCAYVDSYGDELISMDVNYDDGEYAGTITVTASLICDYRFLDISSSVSGDMICQLSVGDQSDTIRVPANGYIDDYELGKTYSSSNATRIDCRSAD